MVLKKSAETLVRLVAAGRPEPAKALCVLVCIREIIILACRTW